MSIIAGESKQVVYTVSPEDAPQDVVVTNSNETVCEYVNGDVKALKAGTATLTFTSANGEVSATLKVTVKAVTE